MASQPTFDLQVPGRPDSSVMDWFAARGFDTWCLDNEGYGRSDKQRPINCDISSGALKAAVFAERHPERVARLALDDSVPTGTYVDMCSKLPLVDPARLSVPTILMRGQYDGIAGMDDLIMRSGLPAGRAAALLQSLALDGWVRQLPGARFIRAGRS